MTQLGKLVSLSGIIRIWKDHLQSSSLSPPRCPRHPEEASPSVCIWLFNIAMENHHL